MANKHLTKDQREAIIYKLQQKVDEYNDNLRKLARKSSNFKFYLDRIKESIKTNNNLVEQVNSLIEYNNNLVFLTIAHGKTKINKIEISKDIIETTVIEKLIRDKKINMFWDIRHELTLMELNNKDTNNIIEELFKKLLPKNK